MPNPSSRIYPLPGSSSSLHFCSLPPHFYLWSFSSKPSSSAQTTNPLKSRLTGSTPQSSPNRSPCYGSIRFSMKGHFLLRHSPPILVPLPVNCFKSCYSAAARLLIRRVLISALNGSFSRNLHTELCNATKIHSYRTALPHECTRTLSHLNHCLKFQETPSSFRMPLGAPY